MTHPRRILVVDDNENFLELLIEGLRRNQDYQVEAAQDGDEAVAKVRTFRPHLLILDFQLPGRDGFQVCQEVRADPATESVKILIITADSDRAVREGVLKAGANGLLKKPFRFEELESQVKHLIGDL